MKFLSRLFCVMALAALIFAAAPARADDGAFRNFIWGVSKQDVRHFEPAIFYKEEGNSLYFIIEKPGDYRRIVKYDFTDGRLSGASLSYQELTPPTPDIVMDMFYDEEDRLKADLGDPVKEDFTFKEKTYKNFPQFWGRALREQDLRIRIEWVKSGTRTVLWCYHDGLMYQLYQTAEPVADGLPSPKSILDLPQRTHINP